jgi:hypothetical protein
MVAKSETKLILVEGDSSFPIDMLRYDRATPATERDSKEIERSFRRGERTPFKLILMAQKVTYDRWFSFGWEAKAITQEERVQYLTKGGVESI